MPSPKGFPPIPTASCSGFGQWRRCSLLRPARMPAPAIAATFTRRGIRALPTSGAFFGPIMPATRQRRQADRDLICQNVGQSGIHRFIASGQLPGVSVSGQNQRQLITDPNEARLKSCGIAPDTQPRQQDPQYAPRRAWRRSSGTTRGRGPGSGHDLKKGTSRHDGSTQQRT